MENKRFLNIIVILLLLLNFGTLGFLWFGRHQGPPPPPPHGNAADFLTHELSLTADQQKKFSDLRELHHHRVTEIQDSIHMLREKFFDELPTGSTGRADSLAMEIGKKQTELERVTFDHFRQVRMLCDAGQQKKFDNVIQEALRMMAPPPPGPPPPGK
jgi:hypothetical protein